ncbi:hypothetical protein H2198_008742 [Neophaeococcomyces mojaviensis]|uniref:Uncharacterized protein n=1 Tax=Neophaeococcomyces mojaviensis TaxID=3383035 RepID=A0ACC2ZWS2_9EURO|nr:hypothetical protein H2198_008742 [Knufia sp. JES_112]
MLRTNHKGGLWLTSAAFLLVVGFLYLPVLLVWRANIPESTDGLCLVDSSFISLLGEVGKASRLQEFSNSGPLKAGIVESETLLDDGVLQYTRTQGGATPNLLWLAMAYDNSSWGPNKDLKPRTLEDFLQIVLSQYDMEATSLGLLTSSPDEYAIYKSTLQRYDFPRVTVFMHQGFHDGPTIDRNHRHDANVQTIRRAEMSKLRNYLMLRTLQQERHILWLDADVNRLDDGIVRRMVSHAHEREDVGILTARCSMGGMENYDLNAWRGTRQGPRGWDLSEEEISRGEMELQGQHHVSELIRNTTNNDLVSLDTVGATILYIRASLVWRGLSFPHQYVIGTRWGKDGWDGIESEGLCYRARGLRGGKCMVLGGGWHVEHTIG